MSRIAVALSGGGHRACLFGLGVLLYLSDARRSSRVTSIASVSGGSLANASVAQQVNFASASQQEVEAVVRRVAGQIAHHGTLFAAPVTWAYVSGISLLGGAVLVGTWFLPLHVSLRVLVFVVGLLVFALVAALRGRICGRAFATTLFSSAGRPTKLTGVHAGVDHVICATDLHAGEHVYFARDFVCAYRFGLGNPGELPLHAVVQASAAFPGAFPPTFLRASRFGFRRQSQPEAARSRWLALHDGGVYDNMADQWAQGIAVRRQRWRDLAPDFREADELVVANASAGLPWRSIAALRLPLVGELLTLLRDKSVLYDNGNSLRRQELVSRFDLAEREGRGLRGALVHIPQSPFAVPDAFAEAEGRWPERAARAQSELALLLRGSDDHAAARARWQRIATANAGVATTLVSLGREVTARLLHHAYVLAMVNLHVILGYPLLETAGEDRFRELAAPPDDR